MASSQTVEPVSLPELKQLCAKSLRSIGYKDSEIAVISDVSGRRSRWQTLVPLGLREGWVLDTENLDPCCSAIIVSMAEICTHKAAIIFESCSDRGFKPSCCTWCLSTEWLPWGRYLWGTQVLLYAQLRGNNQGIIKITTGGMNRASTDSPEVEFETRLSALLDGKANHGMLVGGL